MLNIYPFFAPKMSRYLTPDNFPSFVDGIMVLLSCLLGK